MKLNLTLGRIANVPVVLAIDWLLFVIGFTLYTLVKTGSGDATDAFLAIMGISVIVVLHELGHMFMARKFGAKTDSITLHCYGGLAAINMNDWPKLLNKPRQSLLVWLAGPAVNVVLFALLIPIARWSYAHHHLTMWHDVVYLMLVNMSLAIFNLLPVFPMDGGGCLYSVLRMITSRSKAIRITSVVGIIGSLGFLVLAFKIGAIMLGFIGLLTLLACITAPKHPLYK